MHISNPQAVPLSIPGIKPPERPLRWPPLRVELVDTRPPQKRWLREPNLLRLRRLRRRMTTTCTIACRGRRWRQWIPGAPRRCSSVSQSAGPQNDAPVLQLIGSGAAAGTRVAAVAWRFQNHFVFACFGLAAGRVCLDTVDTEPHLEALTQHVTGRLAVTGVSAAAEVKVLMDSGSRITAMSEELMEVLRRQPGMMQTCLLYTSPSPRDRG